MRGEPKPNTETIYVDAGIFGELELEVDFFYSPAEKGSWDEPSVDEEWDIVAIRVFTGNGTNSIDITDLDIDEDEVIKLLEECR